jgi:hypothetical protein
MHHEHMVNDDVDGELMVFDPEEPIITFFFKLLEPMAVPEYTVFPERIHASALPMGWLEKSANPEDLPERRNMVNVWVSGSSSIVHHVKIGLAASMGLDAVIRAALVGIKGPGEHKSATMPDDLAADCTVIEIALPVWVNLTLRQRQIDTNGNALADVRDAGSISVDDIDALFDMAIDRVRHLQMAYHAIENGPVTLITAEVLPPLVPYLVRRQAQIEAKEDVELNLYESKRAFNAITRPRLLSNEQISAIYDASSSVSHNPLATYLDLDREAFVALRRSGNTRVSVVMAAAAAEVILDRTLLLLQWEEGKTPESAASGWRDALKTRVELDFSARIGGSWDLTADKPVGRWARKVAAVRNRVVHGGYLPSREEAEEAIEVARELVTFICDRLASEANLKKYTRSAVLLAGNDGLEKRGRRTKAVKMLQNDPTEPQWAPTFGLWFKAFSRLRSDSLAPRASSLKNAKLLAVYFPSDWPKYVAHDDLTGQAVEVEVPASVDLGKSREVVNQIFTEHAQSENFDNPISAMINGGIVDGIRIIGNWVEEYHLVPLRGVMVDWSNFTA